MQELKTLWVNRERWEKIVIIILLLAVIGNTINRFEKKDTLMIEKSEVIDSVKDVKDNVVAAKKNTNTDFENIDYDLKKRSYPPEAHIKGDWYSAIIKEINPEKDNYKAYCRYIVHDIVKQRGNDNNLVIEIYDNDKAYEMYEGINNGKILNKKEMQFVLNHTVGAYDGTSDMDGVSQRVLHFYEDGPEKYRGYEDFNAMSN